MNTSYLITFANVFDRKSFDDNIDQFFYSKFNSNLDLKDFIVSHSNTFIEFNNKRRLIYFSYYTLLENLPNTKIVKKLVKGKKTNYIKIKKDSYLWLK